MPARPRRKRTPPRRSRRAGPSRASGKAGFALLLAAVVGLVLWRTQYSGETKPSGSDEAFATTSPSEHNKVPSPPPFDPFDIEETGTEPQSGPPEDWSLPSLVGPPPGKGDPPSGETPAQSLMRLREALVQGKLGELPVGTISRGDWHYFHVSRPATWSSARRMAQAFGGHLAIVENPEDLSWLARSLPPMKDEDPRRQLVWIGATRQDSDSWRWVSSAVWQPESEVEGDGDFATIDRQGALRARSTEDEHPFFIQWHRDGLDPTKARLLLAITGQSIPSGNPIFPVGTERLGERRLFVVKEPGSYGEALELAQMAGAKLMTVATEEEADWLEERLNRVDAPDTIWLGATMTDHAWSWNDSQPWNFARWSKSSSTGSGDYLLARRESGWDAQARDFKASGLILEWSDESVAERRYRPLADHREFTARARELLGEFQVVRNKAIRANTDSYLWQLDLWLRRRSNNSEIARWTPRVRAVKKQVQGGRIPGDLPRRPDSTYPGEIHELAVHHLKKQQEIDKEFFAKAQSIRDSYVDRLEQEVAAARTSGQREATAFFTGKIAAAADIRDWTKSLGY